MNTEPDRSMVGEGAGDAVETALRQMTAWRGALPRPAMWERAVGEVEAENIGAGRAAPAWRWRRLLHVRIPAALAAVLAVAAIGVMVTAMMPSVRENRMPAPSALASEAATSLSSSPESHLRERGEFSPVTDKVGPAWGGIAPGAAPAASPEVAAPSVDAAEPVLRSVVRKATIELKAADVRVAAQKAVLLINEAGGEYVQESAVRGEGEHATGQLVLRVAAARLSTVLGGLRALGEVTDESASGTDVTGQVVDLEARLRNEQRVEVELLDLLEKREDAPLDEVLELRGEIARVREVIESITAQRDQLSRLVSLATVLVIIRSDDGSPAQQGSAPSMLAYFGESIDRAWRSGVRTLADTLGLVVRIAVGGMVWWVLAAVVAVVVMRWSAQRRARAGTGAPA